MVAALIAVAQDGSTASLTPGPVPDLTVAAASIVNPAGTGRFYATTVNAHQLSWVGAVWCAVRSSCTQLPVDTSSTGSASANSRMAQAHTDAAPAAKDLAGIYARRPAPTIDLGQVAGPSAGLMLTLAELDAMTDGDLTAGLRAAGTGTITPSGTVGPIGGITVKMAGAHAAGAQLFLAQQAQVSIARGTQPGLDVQGVATVTDAITLLCARGATDAVCADY